MSEDLLITNVRIVNHDGGRRGAVAASGGRITGVFEEVAELPQATTTVDGGGLDLLPGLVDAHMHLNLPSMGLEETIRSETSAAAVGGVTTVIHLAAAPGSLPRAVQGFIKSYEGNGVVDLNLSTALITYEDVDCVRELVDFGIASMKFLLPYKRSEGIEGVPDVHDGIMYAGMREVAALHAEGRRAFVRVHAETVEIFEARKREYVGRPVDFQWGDVRAKICELDSMGRCIHLASLLDCPLYIVHMTVGEGPKMVADAQAQGRMVLAETCPQYLMLTKDEPYGPILGKVNPPLREGWDIEQMWEGIDAGTVSVVATDHTNCCRSHKLDFWDGAVGISVVELMLPILLSEGVAKGRITLEKVVELLSYNPARTYGLAPRKGRIEVGADADLVLVDVNKRRSVNAENMLSAADYTVFEGRELTGWPVRTWLRGHEIARDHVMVDDQARGEWVPADTTQRDDELWTFGPKTD